MMFRRPPLTCSHPPMLRASHYYHHQAAIRRAAIALAFRIRFIALSKALGCGATAAVSQSEDGHVWSLT